MTPSTLFDKPIKRLKSIPSFVVMFLLMCVVLCIATLFTVYAEPVIPPRPPSKVIRNVTPARQEPRTDVVVTPHGAETGLFLNQVSPGSIAFIYFETPQGFPLTPRVAIPLVEVEQGYSIKVGGQTAMIGFALANGLGFVVPHVGEGTKEVKVTAPNGAEKSTATFVKTLVPLFHVDITKPGNLPANSAGFATSSGGVRFLGNGSLTEFALFDGEQLVLMIAISGVFNNIAEDGGYVCDALVTMPGGFTKRVEAKTRTFGNVVPGTQDVFIRFPLDFPFGELDTRLKIEVEIAGVKSYNHVTIRARKQK